MDKNDIRWVQRFNNYRKALKRLVEASITVNNYTDTSTMDLLKEGLIQRFEFTQELAWKLMKDYLEYQGETNISGSRDAIRKSLAANIIDDPEWLQTINTRNITSHTYDDDITTGIYHIIITSYIPLMQQLERRMLKIIENENS